MSNFSNLEHILFFKEYDNVCPICNKELKSKSGVSRHINLSHSEFEYIKELQKNKNDLMHDESIECPYCKKEFSELLKHLRFKHNISRKDFENEYPLIPLSISKVKCKKGTFKCPYCEKIYELNNSLMLHIKINHNSEFLKMKEKEKKDTSFYFKCPICDKSVANIRQHANETHNLKWNVFCEKYNWDLKDSYIFSQEHRETLSKNKKHYYNETDEGLKRKIKQSELFSGDKNVACNPDVKLKISKTAIKRMKENKIFNKSYGISVNFKFNNEYYRTRSFEEFKVLFILLKNNIKFNYESYTIKYPYKGSIKRYLCNLEIDGEFFEIKSDLKRFDKEKYEIIKNEFLKQNKNFYVVTLNSLKEKFKLKESYNIIDECKKLLNKNNINFTCYSYYDNSLILKSIDENYKQNKNIKFIKIGTKMAKWEKISKIEVVEHDDYVYDIELEKNHYFSANNIISHNCRLRNSIENQVNEFSFTLGAGGEMTGSKNVMTINLNRLIQDKRDLRTEVDKVHKYQVSVNDYFMDLYNKDMLPVFKAGYNSLDKQFLTIGINGIVEGAEYLGYTISNNPEYMKFISDTLKEISDINKENSKKYNVKFNTEFIPGENVAVVFAKKDKADGYKVTRDCYSSYIYAPEDENISILDKFEMMGGKSTEYLDGGSAYHCNLDDYPSKEQFIKLLEISSKTKCKYFCFNIKITICNDCGNIDKHTLTSCPKCGSKNIDYGTRIIGYLKRISNFSTPRQKEHALRYYSKEK